LIPPGSHESPARVTSSPSRAQHHVDLSGGRAAGASIVGQELRRNDKQPPNLFTHLLTHPPSPPQPKRQKQAPRGGDVDDQQQQQQPQQQPQQPQQPRPVMAWARVVSRDAAPPLLPGALVGDADAAVSDPTAAPAAAADSAPPSPSPSGAYPPLAATPAPAAPDAPAATPAGDEDGNGEDEDAATPSPATAANAGADDDSGPDDMTCAICLEQIAPADLAVVKTCRHEFCCQCILAWVDSAPEAAPRGAAAQAARESCPCCKARFSYLYTHRLLDGSLSDYPVEESVTLLLRSSWFRAHAREEAARLAQHAAASTRAGRRAGASAAAAAGPSSSSSGFPDWADEYEAYLDAQLEDDEELEGHYLSGPGAGPNAAAARRAAEAAGGAGLGLGAAGMLLGNRRWGEGGVVRAGRMYARPRPPPVPSRKGGGGGSKAAAAAAAASAAAAAAAESEAPGRRAKRAAKRAAVAGGGTSALDAARGFSPPCPAVAAAASASASAAADRPSSSSPAPEAGAAC